MGSFSACGGRSHDGRAQVARSHAHFVHESGVSRVAAETLFDGTIVGEVGAILNKLL